MAVGHADTLRRRRNARIASRLAARKNSKNYLVIIYGVAGKIDVPARAGILASFEPEGEAA